MNQLIEWLSRLFQSWKFWVVIAPWDIGVRVRLGKSAIALTPGLHLRIPLIDEITLVNTRLRIEPTPTVTIAGAKAGTARVVSAQVGYAVVDPVRAMLRYNHPGAAVTAMAQSQIAAGHGADATKDALTKEFGLHGIEVIYVYYTEDVEVKTFRFLNAGGGIYSTTGMVGAPPGQSTIY